MEFKYEAYNIKDGVVTGRLEAGSEAEARTAVVRNGLKPLRVSQAWRPPPAEEMFPSFFKVGTKELVGFSRQLATMLASGGGLIRTLEMLSEETTNRVMQRTIEAIRHDLDEGSSLSEAIAQHPKVFNALYVSVIEVGEFTGRLGPSLEQMSDILEREAEAKSKAIQTMMYPMAIIGLSVLTLGVLMTVALPPLLSTFDKLGAELPLMTRIAIGGATMFQENIVKIPIALVGLILVFVVGSKFAKVKYWMDAIKTKLPIMGSLMIASQIARISRTCAMLLEAEVGLAPALQLARSGIGNALIRKAFDDAEDSLMSGHGIAEALARHPVLPSMFIQLMTIGEASNSLARTMADAADAYQKQFDQRLNTMLGMLEPASTLVVGGIVGFIAMSMFVPIYSGISAIE